MVNNEELKHIYDREYVLRLEKVGRRRVERLARLISLDGNEKVADFACGSAMLYDFIHDRISDYYGVDFSEAFIEQARKRIAGHDDRKATLYCGEIVDFCRGYPDFFDKAFAFDFTEHIFDKDLVEILSAIRQSLKEGGELYIHTPNGDYFLEILKKSGMLKQIEEHVAVRNSDEYRRLLGTAGFNSVQVRYLAHYNIMKNFHPLAYMPFLGGYFRARLFITCRK